MNKKAVETISVNAVRDSIVCSDFLDQYIQIMTKSLPGMDQFIYTQIKARRKTNLKEKFQFRSKVLKKMILVKKKYPFPFQLWI